MVVQLIAAGALALVFMMALVLARRKRKSPIVAEAARLMQLHDHGTCARGKYRGLRFVIDLGSPEELRSAGSYGSFLSSAMSAAERMLSSLCSTLPASL